MKERAYKFIGGLAHGRNINIPEDTTQWVIEQIKPINFTNFSDASIPIDSIRHVYTRRLWRFSDHDIILFVEESITDLEVINYLLAKI